MDEKAWKLRMIVGLEVMDPEGQLWGDVAADRWVTIGEETAGRVIKTKKLQKINPSPTTQENSETP